MAGPRPICMSALTSCCLRASQDCSRDHLRAGCPSRVLSWPTLRPPPHALVCASRARTVVERSAIAAIADKGLRSCRLFHTHSRVRQWEACVNTRVHRGARGSSWALWTPHTDAYERGIGARARTYRLKITIPTLSSAKRVGLPFWLPHGSRVCPTDIG